MIHPQSVVHSLVEFADGSYKAQLGLPDMRLPIQYALTYPERLPSPAARRRRPPSGAASTSRHWPMRTIPPTPSLARAAEAGGNRGAILNAADEVAVEAFLAGRIPFPAIADTIDSMPSSGGATTEEPDLDGDHRPRRRGPRAPSAEALA